MDFSSWTSHLSEIEQTSADDIDAISRAYESFLSEYPLCYGFWKKYANHKARLSSVDRVVDVYEEAVKVAPYSVDLWADYCSFGEQLYEDLGDVRRLYERGLYFIGKDYRSSRLWDQWLAFEHSHKQWNLLVGVLVQSLIFPTNQLHFYYQRLKKLVTSLAEEIRSQSTFSNLPEDSQVIDLGNLGALSDSKISKIIHNVLDQTGTLYKSQTLELILGVVEYFFQRSSDIDEKIRIFESKIQRPHFHVTPLDDCQLHNWHHYLDYVASRDDFDWTVKLYERCLIPCANYPEFWVRYIEYMEANGGREIAAYAIERAEKISLKKVPGFHEYIAKIKEHTGDIYSARSSLCDVDPKLIENFVDNINQQANLEKRSGNISGAYSVYQKAIDMHKDKQDLHSFCLLYTHFARFTYLVKGELSAAREVFVKGISRAPQCKLLFEGLISFMSIHGGKGEISSLDSIVEQAILPPSSTSLALAPADRKYISKLFLEFVDLCGTIHEIRKAWARHMRLFPCVIHSEATTPPISGSKTETCPIDRETICKGAPSSKEAPLHMEQGKEKENKSLENDHLRPSLENLSICPTNGKDAYDSVSSTVPNAPHHPGETKKSVEISQQFHQPPQHQPPYTGYDQTNSSLYQHPHNINTQMGDQIPIQAYYQHHLWPTGWEAPPHQDGNSASYDHHHQMLYHQYQSQMWHHYYQQQYQNQSYYMPQEKNFQLQQQSIQLNISELENLKRKIEMDHLKQHHPQHHQSPHPDPPRMSTEEAPCSTAVVEARRKEADGWSSLKGGVEGEEEVREEKGELAGEEDQRRQEESRTTVPVEPICQPFTSGSLPRSPPRGS